MGIGLSSFLIQGFEGDSATYNPLRPNRPPLTGDEALQALFRAEQIDEYQQRVSESVPNRIARTGMTYMPSAFSVKREVPSADPKEPWPGGQVIWMDPSADGGLPHTRAPNFICMPSNFPQDKLANTLLHERVHVSQRLHPKAWKKILAEAWDMVPFEGVLPDSIAKRRRINPDLTPVPLFIWKGEYVVLAIFQSEKSPKLTEVDLVWWNPKERVLARDAPPGWNEFFGKNPAGEHPYEIAAYLVAAAPKDNRAYEALKSRLGSLPRTEV